MDPKDYLKRGAGIPLDPKKQKDPEEDGERVPAEGRAEFLNDVSEHNGGQRTDVDVPWRKGPELQRGQRDAYNAESDKKKG
ncbi:MULTISPECIES: hypothetical protein [Myxococcus]|uniref:Uncharacterized protein n=1 Tax=Myxococcus xanthus TaxID=34 RepID=A0A7Y4IG60_MYXXA|nr:MULTISPECIES: hypothetical protein [Myxococcus]NOJ78663.1 hypothetical protein [Myxococcus xanthus]NOJ85289.1 hypothetical protein [Myxococcus xanthus]WNZ61242.1 hypothetical protein QEG98_35955 [Myxococcus sp. MxC21-1]